MATNDLKLWTKPQSMIFINIGTAEEPIWARIGKSTIYDLSLNANVSTLDFIENEIPQDEVDYYKPELPQELATYEGDKAFDYLWDMYYNLPVGTELNKEILLVFPKNIGTEAAPEFQAWDTSSTIVLTNFNTVDRKVTFTIKFNEIERGKATVTDGAPSFTKAE